ncbi:MAG: VWA domain-containing protein [Chloroflexi bacterium]|nr:VWA domain-containing protein [Chloroflexota bacterium]
MPTLSFIWPWLLTLLLLVPVCVLLYRRLQRRRQRDAALLGTLGIVRDGGGAVPPGRRRHIPPIVFLLGLTLLLVATARPQLVLPLPRMEGIVMLAFDVSASMAADDLEPTRMVAAKTAAHAFVERQPSNIKIGVVAFSDGGLVVQTPTDDRPAIDAAIDRLVPQSGTSLGLGILTALDTVSADGGTELRDSDDERPDNPSARRDAFEAAIIVLLTDGENTSESDPLEAAQAAIEQGVRIYTIGVGSPTGATIEIDGFNVFTQLDESTLQEIALLTEGEYFTAGDAEELGTIYENLDPQFVVKPQEIEVTSILGGVSALVLLVGGGLSLFWFGRIP